MNLGYESDEEDSFIQYKRSLRGRAGESLRELHQSLDRDPSVSPAQRKFKRSQRRDHSPPTSHNIEHADYSYGAAVDRLRSTLTRYNETEQRIKTVQFSPRSRGYRSPGHSRSHTPPAADYGGMTSTPMSFQPSSIPPRGEIPSAEEVVPLMQNQSAVLQQLEVENRYTKEELQLLKQKTRELVEENRMLHEELKKTVVQEILQGRDEGADVSVQMMDEVTRTHNEISTQSQRIDKLTKQDYTRWRQELERVNSLHNVKTSRLESQLQHCKDEINELEQETETLRAKLRVQDSLTGMDQATLALASGLCIRCGQNEAVLPSTIAGHKQTIDRITKERDEAVGQVMKQKSRITELEQREEAAYQQVKKSIEMVEQGQLEQTQALVQREQLKEELMNMRKRIEEHTESMNAKMHEERELARKESRAERDELTTKLREMTETLSTTQLQLDKVTRDKVTLMTELDITKEQVNSFDMDYNKATDSMKMTMTTSSIERDVAMRELKKAKQEIDRLDKENEADKQRLRTELNDVRRRLDKAERELVESKEQCIHLTTNSQALEREAHLAKLSKESIERNRSDDLKSLTKRAEAREQELNILLDNMEAKHAQNSSELEGIVTSQTQLVQKLREECRRLSKQLEDVTKKYKGDNKNLKTQNDHLKVRVEKLRKRVGEMEDTNEQHGILQEKMRTRLRQMDDHAKHSSTQILELLAKEGALIRDRQLLAREVEFLRQQALTVNESDFDKIFSSRRHLVDDVLNTVRIQEEVEKKTLFETEERVSPPEPEPCLE